MKTESNSIIKQLKFWILILSYTLIPVLISVIIEFFSNFLFGDKLNTFREYWELVRPKIFSWPFWIWIILILIVSIPTSVSIIKKFMKMHWEQLSEELMKSNVDFEKRIYRNIGSILEIFQKGQDFSTAVEIFRNFVVYDSNSQNSYRITIIKLKDSNILEVTAGSPAKLYHKMNFILTDEKKQGLAGRFWLSSKNEWYINIDNKEWKEYFLENFDNQAANYEEMFMVKSYLNNEKIVICLDSLSKNGISEIMKERMRILKNQMGWYS